MKKLITLLVAIVALASCSQTETLVRNERARGTYSKVYYKNKIIYNTPIQKDKLLLDDAALVLSNDDELSESIVPLEQYYSKKEAAVETAVASNKNSFLGFKSLYKSSNFEFLSKKVKSLSPELKSSSSSAEDVLGVLGFSFAIGGLFFSVLGNLSVVFGALGLLLIIVGFAFSIVGLKGGNRGLAIAGLVISGLYIFLVLLLLLLVASIASSVY